MTDSQSASDAPATLQGWTPDPSDKVALLRALDKAFDYRGDVTITLTDGRTVEGYIFDRRTGLGLDDSIVRILPSDAEDRVEVVYAEIAGLSFTGKDAAHGKGWENWVKRYIEKKQAAQSAVSDEA